MKTKLEWIVIDYCSIIIIHIIIIHIMLLGLLCLRNKTIYTVSEDKFETTLKFWNYKNLIINHLKDNFINYALLCTIITMP